jgi:hypothetical protein
MGLLAHIHQIGSEVTVSLRGQLRHPELVQLGAILAHFRHRGCRTFVVDFSRVEPLNAAANRTLQNLMGNYSDSASRTLPNCAIRSLADTPAARAKAGRRVKPLPAA